MKKYKKTILLGLSLFLFHLIYVLIWSLIKSSFDIANSLNSVLGIGVYMVFYALWAYFLFSFIFLQLSSHLMTSFLEKMTLSLIIITISYFLFRIGDIVDGDFLKNFQLLSFLAFILTAPVILLIDYILPKTK